jgi:hypothetical protein
MTSCEAKAGKWCPSCRLYKEQACRLAFEEALGVKFPKARPAWLLGEHGRRLELDGYSSELGVAFEYHGKQHFERVPFYFTPKARPGRKQRMELSEDQFEAQKRRDQLKRDLCVANGVRLIEVPWYTKDVYALLREFTSALPWTRP